MGTSLVGLELGNYVIVLLQRVVAGGETSDVVIHADTRPPPDGQADSLTVMEMAGLVDVDGDATLELVTTYDGYEWGKSDLWDVRGNPTVLLGFSKPAAASESVSRRGRPGWRRPRLAGTAGLG